MTNSEIFNLMDNLGMLDTNEYDYGETCYPDECKYETREDRFEEETKDLVYTMNFVDYICVTNDINTIEKFLTALLFSNHKN